MNTAENFLFRAPIKMTVDTTKTQNSTAPQRTVRRKVSVFLWPFCASVVSSGLFVRGSKERETRESRHERDLRLSGLAGVAQGRAPLLFGVVRGLEREPWQLSSKEKDRCGKRKPCFLFPPESLRVFLSSPFRKGRPGSPANGRDDR